MKKIFGLFFIVFLSLEIIFCQDNDETRCKGSSSSVEKCKELLSDNEKLKKYHCCLFTGEDYKDDYISNCRLIDEYEYEDIDAVESKYIEEGYTEPNIDCKSYYYSLNIVFCLLFILF